MNWYNNNDFNPYAGAGPYEYNPYNDPRLNNGNGRYYNGVPTLYSSAHHAPSSFEEYRHSFQQNLEETRRSFQQNMEECRRTFQDNMEEYRRDFYERHSVGDDNYDAMPWEQEGWVPLTKSGKQKSPTQIRNELQRHIDQCKADGTSNQTRIIEQMNVNSNSFRKFMDPSTYRNQWNATQNGTYWAAAKLLARVAYEKELAKATGGSGSKRKSTRDEYYDSDDYDDDVQAATKRYKSNSGQIKKTRAEVQLEALTLIRNIKSVNVRDDGIVYDSCPELVKKIKAFLTRDGMTKSNLLLALGGLNSNSLNTFLAGKRQDQAGNKTYRLAYVFFEQLRIYEGVPKSSARIGNEIEHPYGFPLEKPRNPRVLGQPYRPYGRSSSNSASTMTMQDFLGMRGFF